jgi:hypothetical protein
MPRANPAYDGLPAPARTRQGTRTSLMNLEKPSQPHAAEHHWADWLSVHAWWTALLAGGILCVVALALS